MCGNWYNVRDFGARGDGAADDTAAIRAAIAAIPANDGSWGPSRDRLDHGYVLYFPTTPATGVDAGYRVSSPITVPRTKNIRLLGDTVYSARIQYRGVGNYAFVSEGGGPRAHVYENLYFHRGGVLLGGKARNVTDFLGCGFTAIGDYGIKTAGRSVVGGRVLNCEFAETLGGVGLLHRACDLWIIGDNTKFVRLHGIGVACHSSGVTVRDARFESKLLDGAPDADGISQQPHISIEPDETPDPDDPTPDPEETTFAGGLSEVTGCRFGGERGAGTAGAPAYAIRLGPAHPARGTMTGVLISRNRFLLSAPGPAPDEAGERGAIRITKHVRECVVMGNHFMHHTRPLIQEDGPLNVGGQPDGGPQGNYFVANAIDKRGAFVGIFSGAALGWTAI